MDLFNGVCRGAVRCLLVFLLGLQCVQLIACGGGGGGGKSPQMQEPAVPLVNYSGNRNSRSINKSNAVEVAGLVVLSRALIYSAEQFWIVPPNIIGSQSQENAGDGGGKVTIRSLVNADYSGFITADFQSYIDSDARLEGRYIQRFHQRTGGVPGYIYTDVVGSVEFNNFRIVTSNSDITLHGTVESSGGNSQRLIANLLVTNNDGQDQVYLDHLHIDFSTLGSGYNTTIGTGISGAIYDAEHGLIQVSTESPMDTFAFSSGYQHWGAEAGGNIVARGVGVPLAIRALSTSLVSILLDTDSNGSWEEALRVDWGALEAGEPVPTLNNAAPTANSGNAFTAYVGFPATVHALFSHDDDKNYLSFLWHLTMKPAGSQVWLEDATLPVISFTPDVVGDYVFTAWVNDGVHISESSVVVTANTASTETGKATQTVSGSVEIVGPIEVGKPIVLDGQSAVPNRGDFIQGLSWVLTQPFASGGSSLSSYSNTLTTEFTTTTAGLYRVNISGDGSGGGVSLAVDSGPFETFSTVNGPVLANRLIQLDFNGDGLNDFVVENYDEVESEYQLTVIKNNGDGIYSAISKRPGGTGVMHAGDINGDNRPDVAVASGAGISVYLQTSSGELAAPVLYSYPVCTSYSGTDFGIGDFDGDGLADLVAVDPCGHALVVWKQTPAHGLMAPVVQQITIDSIGHADFADINNDGRMDAVLGIFSYPSYVAVAITQPDGSSVITETFNNIGLFNSSHVSLGDVNLDGRVDILHSDGGRLAIYAQDSNGDFGLYDELVIPLTLYAPITVADLNGDGIQDLCALAGYQLYVGIQRSSIKFGSLGQIDVDFSGGGADSVGVGDINGDGATDILIPRVRSDGYTPTPGMFTALLGQVSSYSKPVN